MDVNLLSQNLLIALSLLVGVEFAIIVAFVDKSWRKLKNFNPKTVVSVVAALLLAIMVQVAAQYSYPGQQLPELWVMALPFTLSLALILPSWTTKKKLWIKPLSIFTVLSGLVFSLIVLNNYYSFYPTLFSVFGNDTNHVLIMQNSTDPKNGSKNKTIEGSLYDTSYIGSLVSLKIPGKAAHFNPRPEWAYIPAIAKNQPSIKLPVIILMPGSPGMPLNWITAGLKETMDNFAVQHHGITPYVFVVDNSGSLANDTECVNSPRGNIETYLTIDVPNYIKQHYNVETNPKNWAIGGLSMGGTCSVMIALRHPDLYRNFLDFGGEAGPAVGNQRTTTIKLFGGSTKAWEEHQPLWLLKNHSYKKYDMGAYFEIGNDDWPPLIQAASTLYKATEANGINSIFKETPGKHTFKVDDKGLHDALPWLSRRLGATN